MRECGWIKGAGLLLFLSPQAKSTNCPKVGYPCGWGRLVPCLFGLNERRMERREGQKERGKARRQDTYFQVRQDSH